MVLVGLFTTLRLGFIQVRKFRHAIAVIRGKYDNPEDEGDISHFQALTTALSATVGIGNIAGVATAIHYGGPGALFWMWIIGFLGMALKYHECTLSMQYRSFDAKGNASGGPMYYIEKALGRGWKPLAVFFAVCAIVSSFGGGNMNQANTVALSAWTAFSIPKAITGLVLAILVGVVIVGGIKRIGAVTSKLAPTMMFLYCAGALAILVLNYQKLPAAFAEIVTGAFTPSAGFGGAAAGVWMTTLLWGVKRGLFSNEAGQGSAPIAHAAAKTKEPVREGVVAMVGPFIDTLSVCTMTGLVILLAGVWDQKKPDTVEDLNEITIYSRPVEIPADVPFLDVIQQAEEIKGSTLKHTGEVLVAAGQVGPDVIFVVQHAPVEDLLIYGGDTKFTGKLIVSKGSVTDTEGVTDGDITAHGTMVRNSSALTSWAFEKGLSPLFPGGRYIVTFSVFLFALSTMISWSYYGDRCVTYLAGVKYVIYYRLVYCAFIFLGAILALQLVWAYGDLALFLMTIPNLIALVFLMPKVVNLTHEYFGRDHIPLR
ncbi:MAG: sodium:alanine symporter family protein [Planctomycetota bacterium]|nr:sodium:alanine symporter family protein [Planctomycetota bacterium]